MEELDGREMSFLQLSHIIFVSFNFFVLLQFFLSTLFLFTLFCLYIKEGIKIYYLIPSISGRGSLIRTGTLRIQSSMHYRYAIPHGTPDEIRTHKIHFRRVRFYPIRLQALNKAKLIFQNICNPKSQVLKQLL